jgi:hypothetical protein
MEPKHPGLDPAKKLFDLRGQKPADRPEPNGGPSGIGLPSWGARAAVLVLLAAAGAWPARAQDIRLELPVACTVGTDCFIQNYVDLDPGPSHRDYACGQLTYDGDGGTDFRLPDYVAMMKGVEVRAAAPGVVRATRDDMPDVNLRESSPEAIRGREGGNGVVIDHGGGWTTQYSHMRRGSVRVKPGERVESGQGLGLVGLSGHTEFPHVEFKLRYQDRVIDPFVGLIPATNCGSPRKPLWSEAASQHLGYIPTGLLISGLAEDRPEPEAARWGHHRLPEQAVNPKALVLWVDLFGVMKGDEQRFTIVGPDGAVLLDRASLIAVSKVAWFGFAGVPRPTEGGWQPGIYRTSYILNRGGNRIVQAEGTIEIVGAAKSMPR